MNKLKISVLVICLLTGLPSMLLMGQDQGLPLPLISTEKGKYSVCVDKSCQRLYVYDGRRRILEIPCSTGMNSGNKQIKGDKRTPEGVYFFEKIIDGKKLPKFYGWRAYVLDYPNPVDKANGKNGNGIWIHGRIIPLDKTDTKGCVSLINTDLKRIAPYLDAYMTPVITLDQIIYVNKTTLCNLEESYRDFVYRWINAWANKELEKYRSCYSDRFYDTDRGYCLDDFVESKAKTFKKYNYINISIDQLRIAGADGYILAYFLMDYSGDYFQSTGIKYIYIKSTSLGPKILSERFIPLSTAASWSGFAQGMKTNEQKKVLAFVDSWKRAWEAKDIDRLKTYYSSSFPDRNSFFAKKEKNLASYKYVDVELDDIELSRKGAYWNIRARQRFSSDIYQDLGKKSLRIVMTRKDIYILKEAWERIPDGS